MLRDQDKLDQLATPKYTQATGIYDQLMMHYLPNLVEQSTLSQLTEDPNLRQAVICYIDELISNPTVSEDNIISSLPADLRSVLQHIMNDGLNPISWETFQTEKQIQIQDIKYSYATYMLWQISFVFDISNPQFLEKILLDQEDYLGWRLRFIASRDQMKVVELANILSNYFASRISYSSPRDL